MDSLFPRSLLLLAVLYTGLNCVKPLVVDDTAYFYFVRQSATAPLDPYGHWILWYDAPQPANEVLAPAALPYYLAPAMWLFPQQPVVWKLWLFPVALLFIWALHDLFRRFAPGLEVPMTWLTVLSPAFLPTFNLMLDVPAVALALTGVAVFLRALDRDSVTLASFAGLIAGVAMQTKYTAGVSLAVMLAAAVVWRKPRLGVPAVLLAAHVFIAWELVTALLYGQSHFLYALGDVPESRSLWDRVGKKFTLVLPLLGNLGGTTAGVVLVALAGMGVPGRWLLGVAGAVAMAWMVIAFLPGNVAGVWLHHLLFIAGGVIGLGVLATAVGLFASRTGGSATVWFLVAWLVLELVAYYPLTLFPAVRRVMGVVLAASFLAAHLASGPLAAGPGRRKVWWAVAFGAGLGFVVYGVDLVEAWTEKTAAEQAAVAARDLAGPNRTVWYMGHWGFQYYSEAAGLKPVIGAFGARESYVEIPPASLLREGDIVVVPDDNRVHRQDLELDPEKLEPVQAFAFRDVIPLRTVWDLYSGFGPASPKGPHPRIVVQIYRVKKDCVLTTPSRR